MSKQGWGSRRPLLEGPGNLQLLSVFTDADAVAAVVDIKTIVLVGLANRMI